METIVLNTKQELDIYVNPQRQTILRCMRIAAEPMTPKQIAGRVGISASSVQHHMQKLLSIGITLLDHTEVIRGITARYYRVSPATVSFGLSNADGLQDERLAVLQNAVAGTASGYAAYCRNDLLHTQPGEPYGDVLSGVIHLEPEHAKALYAQITAFLQAHEQKTERSTAWEYALIAFPTHRPQP